MDKQFWDEDQIEELLKQVPKVTDHRSKEQVLERLQAEQLIEKDIPKKELVYSKGIRWKPIIASIASIFIAVIFITQLMGKSNTEKLSTTSEIESNSTMDMMSERESRVAPKVEEPAILSMDSASPQSLVYPSQLENKTLFTIGLVSDAKSVPVSFLIPNEVVKEKLGTTTPTKLQLYEAFAPLIDEQSLGFLDYHPIKGSLVEQDKKLVHQLSENVTYKSNSVTLSTYREMLTNTFGNEYQEVYVKDEQGNTVQFDNLDLLQPMSLKEQLVNNSYFGYKNSDGAIYLIPNIGINNKNVDEALQHMTEGNNDKFQSLLLPNITFQSTVDNDVVTITFDDTIQLNDLDPIAAMHMIEGVLLTAASFDLQVKFNHIEPEQWNGMDFTKPIEKPLAANLIHYNF